jgi:hypothetical protein
LPQNTTAVWRNPFYLEASHRAEIDEIKTAELDSGREKEFIWKKNKTARPTQKALL